MKNERDQLIKDMVFKLGAQTELASFFQKWQDRARVIVNAQEDEDAYLTTWTDIVLGEVNAERERQKVVEGWSDDHDDKHASGVLATAGALYAINAAKGIQSGAPVPLGWPWSPEWWKPKSPRHDLIRAAALIVAEIERLDRLAPTPNTKGETTP